VPRPPPRPVAEVESDGDEGDVSAPQKEKHVRP
jgi:hypothetical protein